MDKESILRLELDHVKNIDCDRSIESYDPTTNNHIIFLELKKDINKSYKDVALEFDVSPTTISKIFDSKVNIPRQSLTEVLSVDEVYSKHCGFHKYCFIIYSPQQDKILDVLPSRHKEYLIDYFSRIPRN